MRATSILIVLVMTAAPALAQDIVGIEDCGKAKGADQKAGCLQSNVDYLYRLIKKTTSPPRRGSRMRRPSFKRPRRASTSCAPRSSGSRRRSTNWPNRAVEMT